MDLKFIVSFIMRQFYLLAVLSRKVHNALGKCGWHISFLILESNTNIKFYQFKIIKYTQTFLLLHFFNVLQWIINFMWLYE